MVIHFNLVGGLVFPYVVMMDHFKAELYPHLKFSYDTLSPKHYFKILPFGWVRSILLIFYCQARYLIILQVMQQCLITGFI